MGGDSVPRNSMRIYVEQRAVSRNAGRQEDEQEPVFVIERDDGTRALAHGVTIKGPSRLCYDHDSQPRAWLEADDIVEEN